MEVLLYSSNNIHLLCYTGDESPSFFCSLVYGSTRWGEKEYFWDAMQILEDSSAAPRVCLGDFNDLFCQEEKRGGRAFRSSSSRGLEPFMQINSYVDLGFAGRNFT